MSAKHTTRTEMKGDTSRHGPRVDAKRIANKARRALDHEEADILSAEAREMSDAGLASEKRRIEHAEIRAKIDALTCDLVIAEGEKLLVENDTEIMRLVAISSEVSSAVRKARDLLEALRK